MVNRRFHHGLQALIQMLLGYIMLVLAYTNRFRLNLHKLCKRVLQSAGNRNRATFSYIQIRELLLRQF
ncbi:hypothetical protein D3C81_1686150 [compost metagenome]